MDNTYNILIDMGFSPSDFIIWCDATSVTPLQPLPLITVEWKSDKPQPSKEMMEERNIILCLKYGKREKLYKIGKLSEELILAKYPLYKQMNISNLSGYTQADKDAMLVYILSIRNYSNSLEVQINNATNQSEVDAIVWKFP